MSEQTSSTTATEETNEQHEETEEFQAITSQEDFDKAIQKRIARERAKYETKYADYDDLKASAQKFKEFEESQKTEEQKRQERDAERDRELAELKAEKLRATVADEKSDPENGVHVPEALLTGSTREELEASADALIKFKGETQKPRVVVRREAASSTKQNRTPKEEAKREWLQSLNGDDA